MTRYFKRLALGIFYVVFTTNAFAQVYVSHVDDDLVSVVDTVTNTVITTIPVGNEPRNLASNPAGTRIYVPNRHGDSVSVIDTNTNTVIATVTDASFDEPYAAAVTASGSEIWVANKKGGGSSTGSVTIISAATNTVVDNISHVDFSSPEGITLNPVSSRAYVVNKGGDSVTIVNMSTRTVITTVSVGNEPRSAVVTPDGAFVYVGSTSAPYLTKITTSNNSVTTIAGVTKDVRNITINVSGSKVYAPNHYDDEISIINTSNDSVTVLAMPGSTDNAAYAVAIDPRTGIGYVSNDDSPGLLYELDTSTDTFTETTVAVTRYPRAMVARSLGVTSSVPTMSIYGLGILASMIGLLGMYHRRRK